MQICCTKKLQDEMGFVAQVGAEENDIFCWSTHLITVNRRKTAVVVNDSCRFGFILYGLKSKDFKGLEKLITQGIKNIFKEEKIKDEIIEKYFEEAGDLKFSKTRGPRYVARLNKACERVDIFYDKLDKDSIFQPIATKILNDDFIKINKESNYEYTNELLHENLRKRYGDNIIKSEAVELMIKLDLGRYIAWRRIITPIDISFKQLHKIIQIAFDWKNYHLYDFAIFDNSGRFIPNIMSELEDDYEDFKQYTMDRDSQVPILDYYKSEYKIIYRYDYGDNWEHEITIRKFNQNFDKNYPICLMGEGDAPPENVGGVGGYESFLDILSNPDDDEYEHTKQWSESQMYKGFDLELVNRRLKGSLRI